MTLFREEVLKSRPDNLQGNISLALPVSWGAVSATLLCIVVAVGTFLVMATYTRTETAQGDVVPTGGILRIMPPRSGIVEALNVVEGQAVRRGDTLALIRVEESNRSGTGAQNAVLDAMKDQETSLNDQEGLERVASQSEQRQYAAQITGLANEVTTIDAQIATQRSLVTMANADYEQAKLIAVRGFVSKRDLSVRNETLLLRQQQLAVLEQSRAAKSASIAEARAATGQAVSRAAAAGAALGSGKAQLRKDRATLRAQQGYALVAPETGRVTAVTVHHGDPVDPTEILMMIVPVNGPFVARFFLPVKAIGFVRRGQEARLAMDAYPYDRYGTVNGIIQSISSAPVLRTQGTDKAMPFYVASASIPHPYVIAYGRRQELLPGMTFAARITTERRSLIRWLFDPFYASVGR